MIRTVLFPLALLLIVLFSCTPKKSTTYATLVQAELLLDEHPDSALTLLDSIYQPLALSPSDFNKYTLLRVAALYKTFNDISNDTALLNTKKYYIQQHDFSNAALAAYYCGRVFQAQSNSKKAMEALLEAESLSNQTDNNQVKGYIEAAVGELFYNGLASSQAIPHLKKATNFLHLAKNYKNEAIAYNYMGVCYLIASKQDSAIQDFTQALNIAHTCADTSLQSTIQLGIGNSFRSRKEYPQALQYYQEALTQTKVQEYKSKAYFAIGLTYLDTHDPLRADSVFQLALNLAKESKNSLLTASIYRTLSLIQENEGNFKKALGYTKLYIDIFSQKLNEGRKQAILNIQKKYNNQKLVVENQQMTIQKYKMQLWSIGLCATVLLVFVLSFFIFRRFYIENKKNKKEVEATSRKLREMVERVHASDNSLKSMILHHFGILKKAIAFEQYISNNEKKYGAILAKYKEIIDDNNQSNWTQLYDLMNKSNNGFFTKLTQCFPHLNELQLRILCLLYADFSNPEIAIIIDKSTNYVAKKKSEIREVLRIEKYKNIKEYIDTTLEHHLPH